MEWKFYFAGEDRIEISTCGDMLSERRLTLQNPCEDSGLATSGELGEPSCSGEFEGDICIAREDRKRDYENHDPR